MSRELAINGGEAVRKKPFTAWPVISQIEKDLLLEVLESRNWSMNGPKEMEFSKRFADYCGSNHAFCVSNGTVSLEIALDALGIGPGDEVIVPALTFSATAYAVFRVGASAVYADIQESDWSISLESAKKLLTPSTKAIIPVHLYSQAVDMEELMTFARKNSLWVIEDCAHAHGTFFNHKALGTFGDIGSFSFQESKSMSSGEGGALITDDNDLAERVFNLKNCGRPSKGDNHTFGGNHRMTEFQAAVLLGQIDRLDEQIKIKEKNMAYFEDKVSRVPGFTTLPLKTQITQRGAYGLSLMRDGAHFKGIPAEIIICALVKEGIPTKLPYTFLPKALSTGVEFLHRNNVQELKNSLGLSYNCPIAKKIAEEGIVLPHEIFLGDQGDIDDIVNAFKKIYENRSELKSHGIKRTIKNNIKSILQTLKL